MKLLFLCYFLFFLNLQTTLGFPNNHRHKDNSDAGIPDIIPEDIVSYTYKKQNAPLEFRCFLDPDTNTLHCPVPITPK
uniref:Uncharacterized protein n=1 Tax=Panagrolaimus sp. ES5 TaxID=591445 RepID=A0AC34F190_9BILA